MIYAILNEELSIVENIAESHIALSNNWIQVPAGSGVSIGDTYDGKMFVDQNGNVRLTPEVMLTQEKIEDLKAENNLKTAQIQALSDMLDFYEECIAEMAMVVYA